MPISIVACSHRKFISNDAKISKDFSYDSLLKIISILRVCDSIDYYKDDSFEINDICINPYEIVLNVNFRCNKEFLKNFHMKKILFENTFRKVLTVC